MSAPKIRVGKCLWLMTRNSMELQCSCRWSMAERLSMLLMCRPCLWLLSVKTIALLFTGA